MSAWRCVAYGSPAVREEVPVPQPVAGEALVRVSATGLCHSDLHMLDAAFPLGFDLPFTLGHEIAGTVVSAPSATELEGGDVVVHGVWACGRCARCAAGRPNYCTRRTGAVGGGIGRDGSLAAYVVVPTGSLVAADGLDPLVAAPLTDGGLTSYHAIAAFRDRLPTTGARVVVIGVGGLGHLAVQLLRAAGQIEVLATDTNPAALDLARRCGATVAGGADELREAALAVEGADAVLDFVGNDATLGLALELLGPGGDLVVVGSGGGSLSFAKGALPQGARLSVPFWGTPTELAEVVDLARRGVLTPEVGVVGFDEVPEAYARLRRGEVTGRLVVDQRSA
jgi:alcohol dehydrogenase, propanol-preferring